jgi:hypothetical protein
MSGRERGEGTPPSATQGEDAEKYIETKVTFFYLLNP